MIGCLPTQALAFLAVFVYATHATHATQAYAFEWKLGFSTFRKRLKTFLFETTWHIMHLRPVRILGLYKWQYYINNRLRHSYNGNVKRNAWPLPTRRPRSLRFLLCICVVTPHHDASDDKSAKELLKMVKLNGLVFDTDLIYVHVVGKIHKVTWH